jgi:hypothetical protein
MSAFDVVRRIYMDGSKDGAAHAVAAVSEAKCPSWRQSDNSSVFTAKAQAILLLTMEK